jgi:hypothetical protein
MSVLPAEVHTELVQLLDALQSAENSVRSTAEEHLANNWVTTKPEMLLMGLVEQIHGSNDTTVSNLISCTCWKILAVGKISTNFYAPPLDSIFRCRHFPPHLVENTQATQR